MANGNGGMDRQTLYRVLVGASHRVQNRVASGHYNFLMGNSILVLSWATIFTPAAKFEGMNRSGKPGAIQLPDVVEALCELLVHP